MKVDEKITEKNEMREAKIHKCNVEEVQILEIGHIDNARPDEPLVSSI